MVADQVRVRAMSQAGMPSPSVRLSRVVASLESMRQPSAKQAVMSSRIRCRARESACGPLKAQDEVATTRRHHRLQPVQVGGTVLLVIDDMDQQPAIQHGVEGLPELGQPPHIVAQEPRGQSSLVRLAFRGADRGGGDVDTGGLKANSRAHEHVLAGPAANVQYSASDSAGLREGEERRLGPTDVPPRPAGVDLFPVRPPTVQAPGEIMRPVRGVVVLGNR